MCMVWPALLLLASIAGFDGEKLPEINAEYLNGRKASLPADSKGKVAMLAFGFSYDSRFAVEDWVKAFRARYGTDARMTFYEIPMIGGMARMGKWFIDSGMRKGTPKADQEHVITVYGGVEPWKERLGFTNAKFAYVVLLDREGRVRWRHSGLFDAQAFESLVAEAAKLM